MHGWRSIGTALLAAGVCLAGGVASAQENAERRPGVPPRPLPDGPVVLDSAEYGLIRVVAVTRGLEHPWGLAFLPDGSLLVTERPGRLRRVAGGVLDPTPITGAPEVHAEGIAGLMDVALHPEFAANRLLYLTYTKPQPAGPTVALARARLEGAALADLEDLVVLDPPGSGASRIGFGPDGMLYMTVGGAFQSSPENALRAQDPNDLLGKVLRLRDDGTAPDDNPFVGRADHRPEIYSLGHRNHQGLAFQPGTGALWVSEHAPQGGDEVNVIEAGRNYGWPIVSYSRQYTGQRVTEAPWRPGMELPAILWVPSIAPSGLAFYDGERFPDWRGNLFAGSLRFGGLPRTGHLERIVLNDAGQELRREWLLAELRQRIRDVRSGPDGLLYVLTDADDGALLRIEPVAGGATRTGAGG
ncbi:MAG: PQQ-dependent sugar dehydrogenase [Acidobacteria bacterium]|nr:PQQ-dependent sugar dehydrogenase [Acidobacteriota bacterium]